jgi:hypothetical protein
VNAVEAWLGSLPGHAYANVRQPPISTLNLAHMIRCRRCGPGRRDDHFAAPPLLFGKTEGFDPVPAFLSMSAMSVTRWSLGRPAPASRCCWR